MKIQSFSPSKFLSPYVQKYLIIKTEEGIENQILPAPHLVLSFQLSGRLHSIESEYSYDLPRMGIAGFRKSARTIIYPKKSSALLVLLTEIGAANFFHEPISEFNGKTLSLELLIPNQSLREIEEKLFESSSDLDRINLIENFLIQNQREQKIDPIVSETLLKIKKSNGNLKIKDLKHGLPSSLDSLEKKFKNSIGTTMKHYSNLLRIHSAISSYSNQLNLTEIAYNNGFFDQSHFNKEFKLFTGKSPKTFFEQKQIW
ncbi:helix-turn-helix domain-containing protein [Leptospira bouyouniensis]|uniref:helix-turn-helix domain-containing protein n=1 Tax=Leptospira bouyouniensis TaxID=2484911 RepID=UPI0010913EDC|nr:helix-turn-helix domain-containing protein [Leptospira bouyouniensis]TGM79505.1 AraC family transcriptional regulator [Leptospira bouyouniensis]